MTSDGVSFRDTCTSRGWMIRRGGSTSTHTPTHFLLDGGKLAVPDEHAGTFLNIYFNALRKEPICLVELKTPVFKLFLDIDARVRGSSSPDFQELFSKIHACATRFFSPSPPTDHRMIVCSAESKHDTSDDTTKYGHHVVFPGIRVNAPIAMAFRSALLEDLVATMSFATHNAWDDVIDDSVYKANGLRVLYSHKGKTEGRPYIPALVYDIDIREVPAAATAAERRILLHDCSIRVFDGGLTTCTGGEDALADQPTVHSLNGIVSGKTVSLGMYTEALEKLQEVLPEVYSTQRFTGAFVTNTSLMFRSTSRFCHCVMREHRTSTVYFCVSKRTAGAYQKCYCRKDDHGCAAFSGPVYPLSYETLRLFFPEEFAEDDAEIVQATQAITTLPSKKNGSISTLLKRSRFLTQAAPPKKKKKNTIS